MLEGTHSDIVSSSLESQLGLSETSLQLNLSVAEEFVESNVASTRVKDG